MKERLFLTFNKEALDQPILSQLTTRFDIVFNIFGATVDDAKQFIALELEGTESAVQDAVTFLKAAGVEIRESDQRGSGQGA